MAKKIEKGMTLFEPPDGKWLKKGESIMVTPGSSKYEMSHTAPQEGTERDSIIAEVRNYLLGGDVSDFYSTRIWFPEDKPCDIEVRISKKKGIRVYYKMG